MATGIIAQGSYPTKEYNGAGEDASYLETVWLKHSQIVDGAGNGSQHFTLISRETLLCLPVSRNAFL